MQSYVPGLPEKIALGCDRIFKITHEDLTEATANTAEEITVFTAPAGTRVGRAVWYLKTPFQDASDSAFNTTTMELGDTDTDRHLTATEANVNGTEVIHKVFGQATDYMYTAATDIKVRVNSMSGKSLSNIDTGEVYIGIELKETVGLAGF